MDKSQKFKTKIKDTKTFDLPKNPIIVARGIKDNEYRRSRSWKKKGQGMKYIQEIQQKIHNLNDTVYKYLFF